MHGGISPSLNIAATDVFKVERFQEPPNTGLLCDLLWADPMED